MIPFLRLTFGRAVKIISTTGIYCQTAASFICSELVKTLHISRGNEIILNVYKSLINIFQQSKVQWRVKKET